MGGGPQQIIPGKSIHGGLSSLRCLSDVENAQEDLRFGSAGKCTVAEKLPPMKNIEVLLSAIQAVIIEKQLGFEDNGGDNKLQILDSFQELLCIRGLTNLRISAVINAEHSNLGKEPSEKKSVSEEIAEQEENTSRMPAVFLKFSSIIAKLRGFLPYAETNAQELSASGDSWTVLSRFAKLVADRAETPLWLHFHWDGLQLALVGGGALLLGTAACFGASLGCFLAAQAAYQAACSSWFISSSALYASAAAVNSSAAALAVSGGALGASGVTTSAVARSIRKGDSTASKRKWLSIKLEAYAEILRSILTLLHFPALEKCHLCAEDLARMEVHELESLVHKGMGAGVYRDLTIDEIVELEEFKQHIWPLKEDCARELLTRARVVSFLQELKFCLLRNKYILVLGEENTGKSTLVQGALDAALRRSIAEFDEGECSEEHSAQTSVGTCSQSEVGYAVPNIGLRQHTDKVGVYCIASNTWMIDFPGSNSLQQEIATLWQQFHCISPWALLLFKATGSVDSNAVALYQRVKQTLTTTGRAVQIFVVLNMMDLVVQCDDSFTGDDVEQLREDFASACGDGMVSSNVLCAVLKDAKFNDTFTGMGILSCSQVIDHVIDAMQ